MSNIYAQIIAGIEQMNAPPARSVNQILNNPARLMYDFKVQQPRDKVKLNLTVGIIEEILNDTN